MWSKFTKSVANQLNARNFAKKAVETLLAIPFQQTGRKIVRPSATSERGWNGLSLISSVGGRKYLNAAERRRFVRAARSAPSKARLFCLTLAAGGSRISEALALTPDKVDFQTAAVCFETLKRRKRGFMRQVPVPLALLNELDREFGIRAAQRNPALARRRLWPWSRTTAWRRVKAVMAAAGLFGAAAMPKGLRHSFGVTAFQARVPPHLVQRWLGHASLRTTAIYADVTGREERSFASRMWRTWQRT